MRNMFFFSVPQMVLFYIGYKQISVTNKDVSKHFGFIYSHTVNIVNDLERKGYVFKYWKDKRSYDIKLTGKGSLFIDYMHKLKNYKETL